VKREFLLNLVFLVFINLLIKPFYIFGIDLGVQNSIAKADYGLYATYLSWAYIFQIAADFGIQNFNNRHISRHRVLLPKYFPNLLALKLLFSVGYVTLVPLILLGLGYDRHTMPLLLVILCNQALVQMTLFLRSNLTGLGLFRLDSLLSSLDKFLMLFTCGFLLWGGYFQVSTMGFALAQGLALLLTLLIVFGILWRKADFPLRPSWADDWRSGFPTLFVLLRGSMPYALTIFLMSAYTRLDAVLLERLLPDGRVHADAFAGAYRVLDACNMFGYLFASLLLPMFSRLLLNPKPSAAVKPLLSLSSKLIWAGSITLAASICAARRDLVTLLIPDRASPYYWDVLGILIWAFVPVCTMYVFSTLLTAQEAFKRMNRLFIWAIGIDILLNLILVPNFAAMGSAFATLCTQSLVAILVLRLCLQSFEIMPSAKTLVLFISFGVCASGLIFCAYAYLPMAWSSRLFACLGIGTVSAFAFGLVPVRAALASLRVPA
jgi:O-antigen/teichoic acid export membrane protein